MKHRKVAEILNSKLIVVLNPEKYKVLCEFGIPLYDTKITALLGDIHTLNSDLPSDCDIFNIPSWNNRERKVLSITRSESLERFEANARESNLIESLLSAVIPIPNDKTRAEREDGETELMRKTRQCGLSKQSENVNLRLLFPQPTSSDFRSTPSEWSRNWLLQ
jgi:hypothetical protein